jgi:aminocarboxymuconate-semialdehyde decarboxylase
MYVTAAQLSDPELALSDMRRTGLTRRVLSPPPMAFVTDAVPEAADYCRRFNLDLAEACRASRGCLVGLGTLPLGDEGLAEAELRAIADEGLLRGIGIPPMIGSRTLDEGPLRTVLRLADEMRLSVLVHPTQVRRAGLERHYLSNLLGNPFETSVAIAGALLGGVMESHPSLRLCFMHGAGCVPSVLGRWDHGWRVRPEPRAASTVLPSVGFRGLYVDTLTHGEQQLRLLAACAAGDRIVLGSDYPFDMGDVDPVAAATAAGLDVSGLARNARRFLGERADI